MLKILIKKEFVEFASSLFRNRREGKKKSRLGPAGAVILFTLIMVGVACGLYVFTGSFADGLLAEAGKELDWVYFALMGILAIVLGTFGSIFNTLSALYKAKDNDLLLSLPIEPWKILFARIAGVYFMSFLFTAILWIPACVRYWTVRSAPLLSIVFGIILTFLIALVVTVIASALGWVVASVGSRLQNKSIVTVIISLLFLGIYYFFIFRLNTIITSIASNIGSISRSMQAGAFPIYHLGLAATGQPVSFIIFAAIAIALFAVCMIVLSRTFIGIVTRNKGQKRVEYKEKPLKESSISRTLLNRELRHFTKSSTYMLNCGLGLIMLPAGAVVLLVYRTRILDLIGSSSDQASIFAILRVGLTALACLCVSMNVITAPSISIEGKNIWILQSLPLRPAEILHSKIRLQVVLDLFPALFAIVVFGFISKADILTFILMILTVLLFIPFDAAFGLRLNLKRPNFDWKSENIPIKQGMPVFIALFAGWGICIGPALLYLLIAPVFPAPAFLAICCAVLFLILMLQERWIKGKGTRLFEELG
ncbi:MAG: hypothetical protein IKG70_09555 [Lachnospiraceae bacterium]|nr:hypothetical protein [Lachnospiraceae bacterium]